VSPGSPTGEAVEPQRWAAPELHIGRPTLDILAAPHLYSTRMLMVPPLERRRMSVLLSSVEVMRGLG
jgi:hypothetical protein